MEELTRYKKSVRKEIIHDERFTIYIDELERVRIDIFEPKDPEFLKRTIELSNTVNKIDTLPLNKEERKRYQRDIANIYQIGLLSEDPSKAHQYAENLRRNIERNLIIRKKKILYKPVLITHLIKSIILYLIYRYLGWEIVLAIAFGGIGGILSSIYQENKYNIDYKVDDKLLNFESFKLIILSDIMAIIGYVIIKSGVLLNTVVNGEEGRYIKEIIYIICGYSQTFIPNILKNFELRNSSGEERKS